jgi:hypothetical protein
MLSKWAIAKRQLEHAERMKGLELGLILPRDEPWWSPPKIAIALGAVVPLGVFLFAWRASESLGYQAGIWISAMIVGTTGIGCGMGLAVRYLTHREQILNAGNPYSKPVVDEDAFDVVGTRG